MEQLASLASRTLVAVVLLILDPLRTISCVVLGLIARPWWVVLPGALIVSAIMEAVYTQFWAHSVSFNSMLMGSVVALIAAWIGLSWRGNAPRLMGTGRGNV